MLCLIFDAKVVFNIQDNANEFQFSTYGNISSPFSSVLLILRQARLEYNEKYLDMLEKET